MQSEKPFSLGILVGRFQVVHAGHEQMIRTALSLCRRVGIFVGSSQESGTSTNPFPYEIRRQLLRNLFGDAVEIYPLPDIGVGNTAAWGDYVLQNVRTRFGCLPDLLVSGKESRRLDWTGSTASRAYGLPSSTFPKPSPYPLPRCVSFSSRTTVPGGNAMSVRKITPCTRSFGRWPWPPRRIRRPKVYKKKAIV